MDQCFGSNSPALRLGRYSDIICIKKHTQFTWEREAPGGREERYFHVPSDRKGTSVDRIISNIFNKRDKWIRYMLYVADFIVSFLSIYLIPNKFLSVLFVLGILFINIFNSLVLDRDQIILSEIENLWNPQFKKIFFCFLYGLALTPLPIGVFFENADFLEMLFGNLIPNVLGASIVYSIVDHMSEFHYDEFVVKMLQTDYIIGSVIKLFYYCCFFNSVNYFISEGWKYTNMVNNLYLFVVIISGSFVGCALFYRIFIDDRPFAFSPKEVYPAATSYLGAGFLVSCNIPSFFLEVKTEPVLLILNTATVFVTAFAFLCFVIRKSDKSNNEYPFAEFGAFSLVLIINCSVYVVHTVEDIESIAGQFISGGGILMAVIGGLSIINRKMTERQKQKGSDNSENC